MRKRRTKLPPFLSAAFLLIAACIFFVAVHFLSPAPATPPSAPPPTADSLASIPAFDGSSPFVVIKDNVPDFTTDELTEKSFESYAPLDTLGRCGAAFACIGKDLMPTEDREGIGQIKPSGWQTVKYDHVDGKYLYNRCHLIGFQLTGENANERNLVTGTRYLNVQGMLPFENMVADYIKETSNHVMYRVTPVFAGDDLLCSGVFMEAYSVEDAGEGISFHVYCYNVQPGVTINYANGESTLAPSDSEKERFILNTNSKRIHKPHCTSVEEMSPKNREETETSLELLLIQGYKKCTSCF